MDLTVTSHVEGDDTVLNAQGSVDIASRDRLAAAAYEALGDGAQSLVVDLSGVTFIDSTGVGTLIELAGRLDDTDGRFAIRHPSKTVARVLEVSGLSEQWLA